MPEPVTCDGDLVLVQTCAFLNQLMETTLFRLRVVVYQKDRYTQVGTNLSASS